MYDVMMIIMLCLFLYFIIGGIIAGLCCAFYRYSQYLCYAESLKGCVILLWPLWLLCAPFYYVAVISMDFAKKFAEEWLDNRRNKRNKSAY